MLRLRIQTDSVSHCRLCAIMSHSTPVLGVCRFCHQREQNKETGALLKTSDDGVTAHFNCMIFSPKVITVKSPSEEFGGFNIHSVKKEIKRGKNMKCKVCGKIGATIGCELKRCRKTYHYMCAKRDGAEIIDNEDEEKYLIYCKDHKNDKQDKDGYPSYSGTSSDLSTSSSTEDSDASVKRSGRKKRKQKETEASTARKRTKAKMADFNESGKEQDSADISEPGLSSRNSDTSNIEQRQKKQQKDLEDTTPRRKTNARKKIIFAMPISENQDANEVCTPNQSSEGLLPVEGTEHNTSCDRSSSESDSSESLLSPKHKLLNYLSLTVAQSTSSPRTKDTVEAQSTNSSHGLLVAGCPGSPSGPNMSSALSTSESVLGGTQNQDGPFADIDTSTKVAFFSEYTNIRDQMLKGDLKEGVAKGFWTKCQTNHCRKFLLENIENSVKSVRQKILSGEAENQDYEAAFMYLWGSGCLESVLLQEKQAIQRKLQSIEETQDRLQKEYKALTDLLGTGK
ncbi:PHD finger protein 11 isoform X2 [Xenopus laevis]|uniref:PHD finger protein 11 isoform X2 n=1 Tax=Xenopus laevis TaxID=8355 RepID=A0A8J1MH64_XENLA|nr:PHD finger protein 11 isoform X2 [Xenopus laevis]